ncbi:hypothetical protein, partial [Salibacter sp.]|uniref:DUF7948 domain-containing protein n=1 Tax=Salibacter sp. TaxID=2010995 RepID=UPI002870170C
MSKKLIHSLFFYWFVLSCLNSIAASDHNTQTKSYFVQNKGQVIDQHHKPNEDVRYLLNANSALNVSLRKKGFSYDIFTKEEDSTFIERIDVVFKNANPNYTVESKEKANDYLNYYSPSIPEGATFIPQFNRVVYQNIYPSIDVEFIANNGDFK